MTTASKGLAAADLFSGQHRAQPCHGPRGSPSRSKFQENAAAIDTDTTFDKAIPAPDAEISRVTQHAATEQEAAGNACPEA